jgi:hypothetical protein
MRGGDPLGAASCERTHAEPRRLVTLEIPRKTRFRLRVRAKQVPLRRPEVPLRRQAWSSGWGSSGPGLPLGNGRLDRRKQGCLGGAQDRPSAYAESVRSSGAAALLGHRGGRAGAIGMSPYVARNIWRLSARPPGRRRRLGRLLLCQHSRVPPDARDQRKGRVNRQGEYRPRRREVGTRAFRGCTRAARPRIGASLAIEFAQQES